MNNENQALYLAQSADSRHHGPNGVREELMRAAKKFPAWPDDMMHAATIIGEEYGELQKAVLQYNYEPHKAVTRADIRAEAIQTIAMLHRFLTSLDQDRYVPPPLTQHEL